MTPTDLRQIFLPVKRVGLHYTHFRNHLPLFMRLPGSQNPKNCQNLHRVAKVGLVLGHDQDAELFATPEALGADGSCHVARNWGKPNTRVTSRKVGTVRCAKWDYCEIRHR